jgi:hypothetical protein
MSSYRLYHWDALVMLQDRDGQVKSLLSGDTELRRVLAQSAGRSRCEVFTFAPIVRNDRLEQLIYRNGLHRVKITCRINPTTGLVSRILSRNAQVIYSIYFNFNSPKCTNTRSSSSSRNCKQGGPPSKPTSPCKVIINRKGVISFKLTAPRNQHSTLETPRLSSTPTRLIRVLGKLITITVILQSPHDTR